MALEKTSFSTYLLRPGADKSVETKLFASGIPLTNGLNGAFVHVPSKRQRPRWFKAISDHLNPLNPPNIFSESAAGMLLIRRAHHTFVVTFGHAWQQLEMQWLELDFGRRVALNAIPPDKVLEVSSQQIFAKKHLARERAPRASNVREFALEYDRDLVAAVEGVPSEPIFGGTVRGSVSLRLSIHFSTLGKVLDRAAIHFGSDEYKKHWPEIDNIVPVSEDLLIAQLDGLLDAEIVSGAAKSKAVLFTPAFVRGDIASADTCAIGSYSAGQARSPYLLYGSWESQLARKRLKPSLATAKDTSVHLFDEAGEKIDRRSVYECLTYELAHDAKQYVLSSGIWHKADDNFVDTVNKFLRRIKPSPINLPAWDEADDEGTYNRGCCTKGGMLHFDAKNISYGGGRSKFEFCDFMDPAQKVLFFVKIASKSSGCSHLVEQVRRTDELLFGQDGAFRAKLKKAFEKHHPKANRTWLDQKPNRGEWKLCMVSLGRDKMKLPFFAKCSVWRLVRNLEQLGHPVFFASV